MSRLLLLVFTLLLAACGGVEQAERRVPEAVRAEANALVDDIMRGDVSRVRAAFPDARGEAFDGFVDNLETAPRRGEERVRNLVGARVGRSGTGAGYNLAYEVDTEAGFTVVSMGYTLEPGGEPVLRTVEVDGSDESMAASRRRLGMAVRLIGLAFALGLILLIGVVIRRRRPAP